jgi:hypothetical protein
MERRHKLLLLALWVLWVGFFCWNRMQQPPPGRIGPIGYTSFEVRVEAKWVMIRNSGSETIPKGWIDYKATLEHGEYLGQCDFRQWKPGEDLVIVIAPPHDPGRLQTFEFTGTAYGPSHSPRFDLRYTTSFDGHPVPVAWEPAPDPR